MAAAGDGDLVVDRTAPGRGAWLCTESVLECCDLAVRRKGFSRALRRDIEAAAVDRLRSYLTTRARL